MPAPRHRVYVIPRPDRRFLYLRHIDPFTHRVTERSAGTAERREAERAAARWERDLQERAELGPAVTLWAEFRERYESNVLSQQSERSQNKAAGHLDSVEEILRPQRLAELTTARIEDWVAALRRESPRGKSTGGRSTREATTIAGYVRSIKAALRWAHRSGLLATLPQFPQVRTGKKLAAMKGRPITDEEFARYVAAVPLTARLSGVDPAPWQRLLRGLWLSGLRLEESLSLSWDQPTGMRVDLSGRRPMLRVYSEEEKGRRDRLLPITPDFAEFLVATPAAERTGLVFPLPKRKQRHGSAESRQNRSGRPVPQWTVSRVSEILTEIGRQSGVVVNDRTGKCVSAHDLRRSFGFRWSRLVMPAVLKELMRHADIATAMQFYVGLEAENTADTVWNAWEKATKNDT